MATKSNETQVSFVFKILIIMRIMNHNVIIFRIPEFAKKQKMSIYCGTWNVNSRTFNSNLDSNNEENVTKFRDWLLPSGNESNAYDLYVIGFQEVVKLDTVNVMISNSQILERVQYWKEKIEDSLKGLDYMFVEEMHLVGLLIFVYAKNTILHNIRDVRVTTVSTGVMGIMGNKGACAIRLDYNLTSMCFICSHFQASRKKVESRNNDYHIILDKAVFLPKKKLSVANELSNTNWFTTSELSYSIWDHDVVFWLGDLNYRISSNISEEDIFNLILSDKWNSLLDNDQLLLEKSNSEVFRDFQEKEIRFPPTYKFILGTNEYDGREDKKKRPPAWCDRILYRILNGITVSVIQQEYNSYQALTISDHKPVYGTYECNISISDVIKERDVYQRLLFVLDKWENSTTPKIDLLARMINFDVVCSGSNKNIVIPIKNTGSVFAHWSFVPKNDDSNICLPWLKLAPLSGFIAPGEVSSLSY